MLWMDTQQLGVTLSHTHLNTESVNRHPEASRYSANRLRMAACHMPLLLLPPPPPALLLPAGTSTPDAPSRALAAAAAAAVGACWSGLKPGRVVCGPAAEARNAVDPAVLTVAPAAAAAAAAREGPLTASGPASLRSWSSSWVRSWLCGRWRVGAAQCRRQGEAAQGQHSLQRCVCTQCVCHEAMQLRNTNWRCRCTHRAE